MTRALAALTCLALLTVVVEATDDPHPLLAVALGATFAAHALVALPWLAGQPVPRRYWLTAGHVCLQLPLGALLFGAAHAAPRRPEVQQHGPASIVLERKFPAIERGAGERGRSSARQVALLIGANGDDHDREQCEIAEPPPDLLANAHRRYPSAVGWRSGRRHKRACCSSNT